MRWLQIAIAVLLLAFLSLAKSADQPLDALKARAESARPNEQGRLFATIARREAGGRDPPEDAEPNVRLASQGEQETMRRSAFMAIFWLFFTVITAPAQV